MDALIQAQIRDDRTYEVNSTSVRLNIPDDLPYREQEEMLQAGRHLAWNRLFRYVKIKD